MRLFVAVHLSPEAVAWAVEVGESVRGAMPDLGAKWVRPESLHLTLSFLGSVPEERIPSLGAALASIQAPAPFSLGLAGLGGFPSLRRPKVLWAGLTGELHRLKELQAQVAEATDPYNAKPDSRPYNPHLTLARLKTPTSIPAEVGGHVGAGPSWQVTHFSLMQSTLQRGGSVYKELVAFPLEGGRHYGRGSAPP